MASDKQQEIYQYILSFLDQWGYPPSVREICAAVDLKSPSTVHFHLNSLEKKGLIVRTGGKTRAISVPARQEAPPSDRIPVLGNVAAGSPILAEEYIEDYIPFDTGGRTGEYFALRVRGESMLGAGILPGDLVVVHSQATASNGEIVVALLEDEATVKRLQLKNGAVWLLPDNPEYEPIDGTGASILGKVSAVIRLYN
ncbi:MAG: transcriptional repressor LexA [Oscillospiraceae bacterium]|nr:transcriptional repressor LexA [Oscillospiraceae bacterium]